MVRPRREPHLGWMPERASQRICDPITLDTAWYRQFSGAELLPGAGRNSLLEFSHALILMGDWCGPKSDTDQKENRGA